ncbi:MAG: hypothetical protein K1Y36_08800 [Blastocatellia bacterium]|nr:hypothetical protein [Blastocatellia bacterium]
MKVEGSIEFTISEQRPDQVVAQMPVQAGILNPFGVTHAGALLLFADVTATILAIGSAGSGEGRSGFPLAITLYANFAGNQKEGPFRSGENTYPLT